MHNANKNHLGVSSQLHRVFETQLVMSASVSTVGSSGVSTTDRSLRFLMGAWICMRWERSILQSPAHTIASPHNHQSIAHSKSVGVASSCRCFMLSWIFCVRSVNESIFKRESNSRSQLNKIILQFDPVQSNQMIGAINSIQTKQFNQNQEIQSIQSKPNKCLFHNKQTNKQNCYFSPLYSWLKDRSLMRWW